MNVLFFVRRNFLNYRLHLLSKALKRDILIHEKLFVFLRRNFLNYRLSFIIHSIETSPLILSLMNCTNYKLELKSRSSSLIVSDSSNRCSFSQCLCFLSPGTPSLLCYYNTTAHALISVFEPLKL